MYLQKTKGKDYLWRCSDIKSHSIIYIRGRIIDIFRMQIISIRILLDKDNYVSYYENGDVVLTTGTFPRKVNSFDVFKFKKLLLVS